MPDLIPAPHPPPPDLDVPAAHSAARLYAAERARGVPEAQAWAEAVMLFRYHHPAWPLPLCEREAVRLVGALVAWALHAGAAVQPRRVPPLDLLIDLATPETPDAVRARDRCTALGIGGALRDVGRVPEGWASMRATMPLLRAPGPCAASPA